MPILDRDPFATSGNGVEKVPEALGPAGRQNQYHLLCIEEPTQHLPTGMPGGVTLLQFLNRDGFLSKLGIIRSQWSKDIIDVVEQESS